MGLAFGYLEGHQAERNQNSARDYAEEAKRNTMVSCRDIEPAAIADCIYREIESAQETSQANQDLQAQQWMARWAAFLTLITLGTTIISWIALRYLRDTFRETSKGATAAADATEAMRESNRLADAAHEAQRRPWLTVTGFKMTPVANVHVDGQCRGRGYAASLSIANGGPTPAVDVALHTHFEVSDRPRSNPPMFTPQSIPDPEGAVPPHCEVGSQPLGIFGGSIPPLESGTATLWLYMYCEYGSPLSPDRRYTSEAVYAIRCSGDGSEDGGQVRKNWSGAPVGKQNRMT